MTKLIGTKPGQVPTNADLGTMAYQDSENVNLVKDSGAALNVNRKSDDGDLAVFRKNGSAVGNIGTSSSTIYIKGGGTDTGLLFGGSNVYPYKTALADNSVNIGHSSYRFKDLYLSGNVVVASGKGIDFSATGQASGMTSEVFDDYEEGTWTPTLQRGGVNITASYSSQTGRYVKTGAIVHAYCEIVTTAITSQGSGYSTVSGLPYAYSGSAYSTIGVVTSNMFNNSAISKAFPSGTIVYFGEDQSTGFPPIQQVWTSGNLRFSFSYYTTG